MAEFCPFQQVRQRDLSQQVIGMSLDMTNAILKRLVLKGYLSVRKVNNRNIAYRRHVFVEVLTSGLSIPMFETKIGLYK